MATPTSTEKSPDTTEDSNRHKVTWVSVDDWNAVYVDGKLVGEQNHSVSPWTWMDVLRALGAEVEDLRYSEIAEELAETQGRFPDTWPPA